MASPAKLPLCLFDASCSFSGDRTDQRGAWPGSERRLPRHGMDVVAFAHADATFNGII